MILDIPLPPEYRLVSVQQVRNKSRKGWLEIQWAVALCVDRPAEETGLHYGFGQAGTVAAATERAVEQSRWRREQDLRTKGLPSLGDLSDILNDLDI